MKELNTLDEKVRRSIATASRWDEIAGEKPGGGDSDAGSATNAGKDAAAVACLPDLVVNASLLEAALAEYEELSLFDELGAPK